MIDECYVGDVRDGLRSFIAAGVRAQTCVTSPPYWGLRDYGTAQWDGGDADCDHRQPLGGAGALSAKQVTSAGTQGYQFRDECGKCGARRIDQQIGLEPTFTEYVQTMVEVFRLVRDVLADDGTLWLNLGDSYARMQEGNVPQSKNRACQPPVMRGREPNAGLKAKDLCGIPWRVAFALQADGWYLRSDVIWHKPNPMPESVTDRPTKAHEYLFLLAKSERYFYDGDAIKEESVTDDPRRPYGSPGANAMDPRGKQGDGNVRRGDFNGKTNELPGREAFRAFTETRNRRTVWSITSEPYADAHFAVMPTALVEPCVLAGSRVDDIVLDPFMGSGTVAQVAQSLGRRWIGCELNPAYHAMQRKRAAQMGLSLESRWDAGGDDRLSSHPLAPAVIGEPEGEGDALPGLKPAG